MLVYTITERLHALQSPMQYRQRQHRLHATTVALCTTLISLLVLACTLSAHAHAQQAAAPAHQCNGTTTAWGVSVLIYWRVFVVAAASLLVALEVALLPVYTRCNARMLLLYRSSRSMLPLMRFQSQVTATTHHEDKSARVCCSRRALS